MKESSIRETIFYHDFASEYSTIVRKYYRSYNISLDIKYIAIVMDVKFD